MLRVLTMIGRDGGSYGYQGVHTFSQSSKNHICAAIRATLLETAIVSATDRMVIRHPLNVTKTLRTSDIRWMQRQSMRFLPNRHTSLLAWYISERPDTELMLASDRLEIFNMNDILPLMIMIATQHESRLLYMSSRCGKAIPNTSAHF